MGPFNDARIKYVLVLVDYLSKWTELESVTDIYTDSVINIYLREGLPENIVTDNGVQFTSHKMKDFLIKHNIKHSKSALYHPQGNGLVERMNRTIKEGIQIAKLEEKYAILATKERLLAYHTTRDSITDRTPFELMRGRLGRTNMTRTCCYYDIYIIILKFSVGISK